MKIRGWLAATVGMVALSWASVGFAADEYGMTEGNPGLKSAGPIAFGPKGVLLIGDTKAATVFAIATGDAAGEPAKVKFNVENIQDALAKTLGASASEVQINDLAVNPLSGNVYLSASKGGAPALVRISADGTLAAVSLEKVRFSKSVLTNAPADAEVAGPGGRRGNRRNESITDLAFVDGKVIVSGMTNAASPSNVRSLFFPFEATDEGASLEIFHGAHGKVEDYATVRTFVPIVSEGEPALLTAFTCTPLVKFPLKNLPSGEKVRGTTVAELGNRNRPLDMIAYEQGGKQFLLLSNSARGVMKISTENLNANKGITERIDGTAGQPYETISALTGVVQMDKLNAENVVVLVQSETRFDLKTIALP